MGNIKSTILIAFMAFTIVSCKDDTDRIKAIYADRDEVVRLFENVSIISRGDFIYLTFHSDTLQDSYVFELALNTDSLVLVADTMHFDPEKLDNFQIREEYDVRKNLHLYLDKMEEYGIEAVSSGLKKNGIPLQLYLKEVRVFYIPQKDQVSNDSWQYYIQTSNKLDDHWYWRSLYDFYDE